MEGGIVPDESKVDSLNYDKLAFAYGEEGTNVIEDISIDLAEGQIVLITGPSGAGKTTICRAANGLIPHEFKGKMRGQVTIAGRYNSRKFGVSALSKIVGVLQQDPDTQLFNPTVEEEIFFGACNYGLPADVIRKRTENLLELTRLTTHRRKNPHNLSGGQQQSCALAAVLSIDPATLVLDEPTSNIDPIGSQEVLGLVARLAREEGRTTLLVEHKLEELVHLVDEMIVIDKGKILHRGTVSEVLEHVEFIDSVGLSVPQVTLLAARLRKAGWPINTLPLDVDEAIATLRPLVEQRSAGTAARTACAACPAQPRRSGGRHSAVDTYLQGRHRSRARPQPRNRARRIRRHPGTERVRQDDAGETLEWATQADQRYGDRGGPRYAKSVTQ